MKLSKKGKYALRALVTLGLSGGQGTLQIQEIADRERIPKKFLEQLLLTLKRAGIVQSVRGKEGGYSLGRPLASMTLGEVIRAIDGPLAPLPCASRTAPAKCTDCGDMQECWLRAVMLEVQDAIAGVLDHITLADVCKRAEEARQRRPETYMYYI